MSLYTDVGTITGTSVTISLLYTALKAMTSLEINKRNCIFSFKVFLMYH